MKFSIITCTYNSARFLEKNLTSVLKQDFSDFEHIFIDGFSDDETVDMIKKYGNEQPYDVQLFQIKPQGISNAMNEGIRRAKGEYLMFLNSDDNFYTNDVLEKVDRVLVRQKYDWIYGKINVVEEHGKKIGVFPQKKIWQNDSTKWWGKYILKFYNYVPHQAVFMKKDVFLKYGFFDETLSSGMDPDLWLRVRKKTKWSFFDTIVSNYCIRSDSQSASKRNKSRTVSNWKKVQSRCLNFIEKIPAFILNMLVEKKNKNYR